MNTYQVFNPLSGRHTRCDSEQEAKELLVTFVKEMIAQNLFSVNEEITHENGDVTWQPVDFVSQIVVSI
jgi:hypothetical protein